MNPLNDAGTIDRYRERRGGLLFERQEIVVDDRVVGQRQCLAGGQEVESAVGDTVSPGCRTIIVVAGTRGHNKLGFCRGKLLRRQGRRDVVVLSVQEFQRNKIRCHRRMIAGIDVGKTDRAGRAIDPGALRRAGMHGKGIP